MNIGILFSDFGPYHIARIESLNNEVKKSGHRLFAFRFSVKSNTYSWVALNPEGVEVITLADSKPKSKSEAFKLSGNFKKELKRNDISVVFLPSYSPLVNFLCLMAAKLAGCKTVLMNESWKETSKTGFAGSLIKKFAVRCFDAAVVGGTDQVEYTVENGMNPQKIFTGYDVVNNYYFNTEAAKWKDKNIKEVPVKNLPERFFLNIGRFIHKKNLQNLLGAYIEIVQKHPGIDIALVLVGEGDEESALKRIAKESGIRYVEETDEVPSQAIAGPAIIFYPFKQVEVTSIFFARCEAFILPSLYEEWGLVVNEAMASGSAVVVSNKVGSARDLVIQGETGFTFDPLSQEDLKKQLQRFIDDGNLAASIGAKAQQHIKGWNPEVFGQSGMKAVNAITQ